MATGCVPPQDVSPQTQAFPVFSEKDHEVKHQNHIYTQTSQIDTSEREATKLQSIRDI